MRKDLRKIICGVFWAASLTALINKNWTRSTKIGHETKKIRHKNIILVQDTLILLTSSRKPPDILCQP